MQDKVEYADRDKRKGTQTLVPYQAFTPQASKASESSRELCLKDSTSLTTSPTTECQFGPSDSQLGRRPTGSGPGAAMGGKAR